MTLTAQFIRAFKGYRFSITKGKEIVSFVRVVAVQAPDLHTAMFEADIGMNTKNLLTGLIDFEVLLRAVTGSAWCDCFGQGFKWNREFFGLPGHGLLNNNDRFSQFSLALSSARAGGKHNCCNDHRCRENG